MNATPELEERVTTVEYVRDWPADVANPDDTPVKRLPRDRHGVIAGPHYQALPGRIAITQTQTIMLTLLVIAQLWILTQSLIDSLSGRGADLSGLGIASILCFILGAIVVWLGSRSSRG